MNLSERPRREVLDERPLFTVRDEEYSRLLGYPAERELSERALELAAQARRWFAEHGRPWIYWREVPIEIAADELRIDGSMFSSRELRAHLRRNEVAHAVVLAVGAGVACENEAQRLWKDEKPDEYFFLETLGSAVVEALIAAASGTICAAAERDGWSAVRHFSPGYSGWDIRFQGELSELVQRGAAFALPERVEVLASGMLRPKKTQLAIVGIRRGVAGLGAAGHASPCGSCSLLRCAFRRQTYRFASRRAESVSIP